MAVEFEEVFAEGAEVIPEAGTGGFDVLAGGFDDSGHSSNDVGASAAFFSNDISVALEDISYL